MTTTKIPVPGGCGNCLVPSRLCDACEEAETDNEISYEMLEKVREAILLVFGDYISPDPKQAKQIIEDATFTGEEDPGQWSPTAAVIIGCESGIPNGLYSSKLSESWVEVSDILGTHYCEHINAAVIGVYPG